MQTNVQEWKAHQWGLTREDVLQKSTRNVLGGWGGVLVISMLVMVSRVYTYVKDHQIIFQIGAVYHILNIL